MCLCPWGPAESHQEGLSGRASGNPAAPPGPCGLQSPRWVGSSWSLRMNKTQRRPDDVQKGGRCCAQFPRSRRRGATGDPSQASALGWLWLQGQGGALGPSPPPPPPPPLEVVPRGGSGADGSQCHRDCKSEGHSHRRSRPGPSGRLGRAVRPPCGSWLCPRGWGRSEAPETAVPGGSVPASHSRIWHVCSCVVGPYLEAGQPSLSVGGDFARSKCECSH